MKLTKKKRKPSLRREIATYNHIARELKREATGPIGHRKEKRKNVR